MQVRPHSRFKALLAVLLFCLMLPHAARAEPLTPQEALETVQTDDILILDVRNPDELKNGVYPGSLNIPMPELENRLDEIPDGRAILIHCAKGVRAAKAEKDIKAKRGDLKIMHIAGQPIFER